MKTKQKAVLCLCCKAVVKGRSDKKFCNDYCRNEFNNALRSDFSPIVRNINNALGKNRRALESLMRETKTGRTTREKLAEKGFRFKYFTHTCVNKNGKQYFFCYDLGYLALGNDRILIVKKE